MKPFLEEQNLKLEAENIKLRNEIARLRNVSKKKDVALKFFKTKNKIYNNLFYFLAIFSFELIFVFAGCEQFEYNYNGFWNTHLLLFFIIFAIMGLIPKIITIIVNILLEIKKNKKI